jgi:hypothetical protein
MAREDSVAITKADAVAHCRQAEEYLRAAEHSLEIADYNAAAGTAIDAGINAADAVAGINLGRRWKGPTSRQRSSSPGRASTVATSPNQCADFSPSRRRRNTAPAL